MEDILQVVRNKKTHLLQDYGSIEIGEDGFNIGLTIDGTKDSCKIKVFNYDKEPLEPYSIAYHPNTQTWWIVSNDKVSRYFHEGSDLYIHTLQLEGAIELLNARDLTDSGFYGYQYTIGQFIERLFALSNFEFTTTISGNTDNINLNETVDYLKTFENYTLGSALRDFLNGYNCSGKLSFVVNSTTHILTQAILKIVPRTGDETLTTLSMSAFAETKEQQEMKRQSFATSVISNAENVISTKAKTYPLQGATRLKTNESYLLDIGGVNSSGAIVKGNAKILLPSPAYKVNWVKMDIPVRFSIYGGYADATPSYYEVIWTSNDPNDFIVALKNEITTRFGGTTIGTNLTNYVNDNEEDIKDQVVKRRTITFYGGAKIKQYLGSGTLPTANIIPPTNVPNFYVPRFQNGDGSDANNVILVDEETYNSLHHTRDGIMWKRGSNEITSFGGIGIRYRLSQQQMSFLTNFASTDYGINNYYVAQLSDATYQYGIVCGYPDGNAQTLETMVLIDYHKTLFRVNYIPMSDIKIKQDNQQESRDITLYNQNGKMTDSNAFSKMLISHAKEVATKSITKYGTYNYPSDTLPTIGQKIYDSDSDEHYVVENVSYDIYANENGYFISGTFELAPNVAVKSLLVNPNTNIRDYGIPQTNNVKRKQIYRDFYEIDTQRDSQESSWYLPITSVVNFSTSVVEPKEHTAVMKITFDDGNSYYYQLDTTTYVMKKSVYEVVDFGDNNIIGYDCQSRVEAFDITKVFDYDHWQDINTPISYVDDNGKFSDIEIIMATQDTLSNGYNSYLTSLGYNPSAYEIKNRPVYISQGIYDDVESSMVSGQDFKIDGTDYGKDPTEVPFFEYSCQIDDGENVLVGEDLLSIMETDQRYAYGYAIVDKGKTTLLNATNYTPSHTYTNHIAEINNYAKLSFAYENFTNTITDIRVGTGSVSGSIMFYTNWVSLPSGAINVASSGLATVQYKTSDSTLTKFAFLTFEYDSTNNRVRFVSNDILLMSGVSLTEFSGSATYTYNIEGFCYISIEPYTIYQVDTESGTESLGSKHTEYDLSTFNNKDLIVVRFRFNQDLTTYNVEPIFVVKNITQNNVVKNGTNFDYIKLYVNYYKS